MGKTGSGFDVQLPRSLRAERHDDVAVLFLARPQKRNAIDDPTVFGIEAFFAAVPDGVRAVVLAGEGDHFCSELDLSELSARDAAQGVAHSRSWHRAFEHIEFGKVPVVAVLHGAVVGGGLEMAAAVPHPGGGGLGLLRAARRPPRHLRRRRRLGAPAAAHRHLAHDGHDAHRPQL